MLNGGSSTPWVMLIISDPCTRLSSKIIGNHICFSRPILSNCVGCNTTSTSMEGVDKGNEVTPPEATAEVEMMQ